MGVGDKAGTDLYMGECMGKSAFFGRTSNVSETLAQVALHSMGWSTIRRGWPDFLCWTKDSGVMVVEVKKNKSDQLTNSQKFVIKLLKSKGIKCMRYSPSQGFTEL